MKIFWIFSLLISLCILSPVFASDDMDTIRKITNSAMEKVKDNKISEMFDSLKPIWPMPIAEIEVAKDQTLSQRKMVEERFGKTIGIEYINTQLVGNAVAKVLYIEKFERHIIRWEFIFYRPISNWQLNTFNWDDQINELFK